VSLSQVAVAAPTYIIGTTAPDVDITTYFEVFEDPERRYDTDDLLNHDFNERFEQLQTDATNVGFSASDWWLRFTIDTNDTSDTAPKKAAVLLDYPLLNVVDAWVFSGSELKSEWRTGNLRPFSSRPIRHRNFLFPISASIEQPQTVYLRIRSSGPVNIGLSLIEQQALLSEIQLEYMAFGAYFGGFLLLALAVLLLYLVDRQTAFLSYLMYILTYGCYMMAFNGFGSQYLWPETPDFGQVLRTVLLSLSIIFLLQFSRSLLGIRRVSPVLHHCVTILQFVIGAILLAVPFFGYDPFVKPLAVLLLLALPLVISMGVVAQSNGELAARYYLLAWSVFLAGVLIYLLKVFGLMPHNFVTHYGFQIGSLFEFIFLSAALGVRVKELRHQSQIDELTGLANRRSFDMALTQEFSFNTRPNDALSLLVIDIDHFKNFNDAHGHAAGDSVLRKLAKVFESQIRRPAVAYRYGGEEFTVLLPRTDGEAALILAERLREAVVADMSRDNITVSIGLVSRNEGDFASTVDFFIAGDQALYQAKHAGRNQVAQYNADLDSDTVIAR